MKKFIFNLSFVFCFLFIETIFSQSQLNPNVNSASKTFTKDKDIFGTRNFIENKGQFVNPIDKRIEVLFVYDHLGEKIYFTSKGLIYEEIKRNASYDEEEMREAKEKDAKKDEHFFIQMNWQNCEQNIEVEKSEKQNYYFTYGTSELNAYAYKKITYKNVYKNIDIEYNIPADKATGIKYNIVLRAGANSNEVKINYTGDIKKITKNIDGEINIKTVLGEIIEHAPTTFDSDGNTIESSFELNKNIISFKLPNNYQQNKTITIDPWVTATTLLGVSAAYDVDYDYIGNTYIYGGVNPCQIAMYNSTGILQWTFSGVLSSPVWNAGPYIGNLGVDRLNNKVYTAHAFLGTGTQIIRLNSSGNYDNLITTPATNFNEIWDFGFSCYNNEVYFLGGGTSGNMSAAKINTINSTINVSGFQTQNTVAACCHDIANSAIDDQGLIFIIYASGYQSLNNKICLINSTFNGVNWIQPSGYTSLSEGTNKSAYTPSGAGSNSVAGSNAFNCLAVNNNYLYYYDGFNLAAYSKLTGANIASITIPGLILKKQGGIAVDDCDNIYLGGNGSILKYNFNGTNFNSLTPIPLTGSSSNQYVYDLKLDRGNNLLYACGSGFVGAYIPANSSACTNTSSIIISTSNSSVCAGKSVTLTANGANSYTWSNGSVSNTIVVSPNLMTSYSVNGKIINACSNSNANAVITISMIPSPSISIVVPKICKGETRTITATGATSYTWNNGSTNNSITINPTGNTSYTVIGTSTSSPCSTQKVITVTISTCASLSESVMNQEIARIFPNPTKDKLNIELFYPIEKNIQAIIYNALGEIIYQSKQLNFNTENVCEIDLENYSKGVYFVKLQSNYNNQTIRLIKE